MPYLDPALPFQIRQEALWINYGFRCSCSLCTFEKDINPSRPALPVSDTVHDAEAKLWNFVDTNIAPLYPQNKTYVKGLDIGDARLSLPEQLYPLLHADYLPALSEEFSRASHEGQCDRALTFGKTLLALYFVLYPPYYPQIGE